MKWSRAPPPPTKKRKKRKKRGGEVAEDYEARLKWYNGTLPAGMNDEFNGIAEPWQNSPPES
jgi:hypothetical protein